MARTPPNYFTPPIIGHPHFKIECELYNEYKKSNFVE